MAIKNLFTNGTNIIDKSYLPPSAVGTQDLESVLVAGNDANSLTIQNLGGLVLSSGNITMTNGIFSGADGISTYGTLEVINGDAVGAPSNCGLDMNNSYSSIQVSNGDDVAPDGNFRVKYKAVGAADYDTIIQANIQEVTLGSTLVDAIVNVNGTSGKGQVYDTVYNIPESKSETLEEVLTNGNDANGQNIIGINSLNVKYEVNITEDGTASSVLILGNKDLVNPTESSSWQLLHNNTNNELDLQYYNGNTLLSTLGKFNKDGSIYLGSDVVIDPQLLVLGSGGATGRVYDTLYNKPSTGNTLGFRTTIPISPLNGASQPVFNVDGFAHLYTFNVPVAYQNMTRFMFDIETIQIALSIAELNTFTFYLVRAEDMATTNFNVSNCVISGEIFCTVSTNLVVTSALPQLMYDIPTTGTTTTTMSLVVKRTSDGVGITNFNGGSSIVLSGDNTFYTTV